MEKKWYIKIDGKTEGPYSIEELKRHTKVTPDTYVWDNQRAMWVTMRTLPELKEVFEDAESDSEEEEADDEKISSDKEMSSELVMELQSGFPPILYWIIFLLIILVFFVLYRI